jgi:lysophospholipase L1-like esterase
MKQKFGIALIAAGAVALAMLLPRLLLRGPGAAAEIHPRPVSAATQPIEPADIAAPKHAADGSIDPDFLALHRSHLTQPNPDEVRVLFLGDSITFLFPVDAPQIWSTRIAPMHPANFAMCGNRTQHVLWQIANGELDHIHPRAVVLLIGTNNLNDPPDNIVRGITKIADEIHTRLPAARLLLLGILPRDITQGIDYRAKIAVVNRQLAKLDNGTTTRFLDLGPAFDTPTGRLRPGTTTDGLHLTPLGYDLAAQQILPLLTQMLSTLSTDPSTKTNSLHEY